MSASVFFPGSTDVTSSILSCAKQSEILQLKNEKRNSHLLRGNLGVGVVAPKQRPRSTILRALRVRPPVKQDAASFLDCVSCAERTRTKHNCERVANWPVGTCFVGLDFVLGHQSARCHHRFDCLQFGDNNLSGHWENEKRKGWWHFRGDRDSIEKGKLHRVASGSPEHENQRLPPSATTLG